MNLIHFVAIYEKDVKRVWTRDMMLRCFFFPQKKKKSMFFHLKNLHHVASSYYRSPFHMFDSQGFESRLGGQLFDSPSSSSVWRQYNYFTASDQVGADGEPERKYQTLDVGWTI